METFGRYVGIIAGNNIDEILAPYDMKAEGEERVLIPYSKRKEFREKHILFYEASIESPYTTESEREYYKEELEFAKESTDEDFFEDKTDKFYHNEKGDAVTKENPNGKWSYYTPRCAFAYPFPLKDGTEAFIAKKKDIDWDKIHNTDPYKYEVTWEMVIDGKKPQNEYEEKIYQNMQTHEKYLKRYGSKDGYVLSNTLFWAYAFVSEDMGWEELDDNTDQSAWAMTYYDRFIKPLHEDTLLTKIDFLK